MNIPRFLQLYKENRLEDAFLSVILDNPLPCSTGRVCQHPCDQRCRRQTLDEAVNMREVHRFIADSILLIGHDSKRWCKRIAAPQAGADRTQDRHRGRRTGGADGGVLSGACSGHDVTVFDSKAEAGGMLRFALPEYRLPKAVLRREIELIERLGVKFSFNTRVGVRHVAERSRRPLRRGLPLDRHVERIVGLSAGHGVEGRVSGADVPGSGGEGRRR